MTGAAMTAAAAFETDPITAGKDAVTTHGHLHGMAAAVGIPGFPIAAALIGWSVTRHPAWRSTRRLLLWSAGFIWISLAAMIVTVAIMLPQHDGTFGPGVLIGWPNRLVMASYYVWLITVAWQALQIRQPPAPG
jgi:hypothetical protein